MTGEIKNISEAWEDFSSDSSENTGHFFPLELDEKYEGEEITAIGKKTTKAHDRYWVLKVEKSSKFTFKKGEKTLFTLDFSDADFK